MMMSRRPWPWPTEHASAESADLLRQIVRVAANDRTVSLDHRRGTAEREPNRDERRRYPSACTSSCRCARFPRGPWPCACPLALGELPATHALDDVGARLETEDRIRQLDRAGVLALKRGDVEFHLTLPPARPQVLQLRTLSCQLELAGLRRVLRQRLLHRIANRIQPPLEPGTAPSTRIRPRSTSVTTRRFCVVTRSSGPCDRASSCS
jgi:hypothetical protein